ncbi:Vta1 like-domain-containing protein [Amylostereum chailletii]|nr:Vta1 like-domain-containing protein [Amylostereum chailletii]
MANSNNSYLGLPPLPADLKAISSLLQRADELRLQDPVIAYWCSYYAAQQGIALRASAPANRAFLSALLSALESLRVSIGPSEAIDTESVSCVYVEDFALRVFNVADNEDRKGAATRSTAKKFLAAATFLEVLKVFEDKTPWESHAEKARYAKWKAADIAKAFREGRKPTPGPAGSSPDAELTPPSTQVFPSPPSPPSSVALPFHPAPQPKDMSPSTAAAQDRRFNAVRHSADTHQPNSNVWSTASTVGQDSRRTSTGSDSVDEGFYDTTRPSVPPSNIATGLGVLPTVGEEGHNVGAPPSPPSSVSSNASRKHRSRAGSLSQPAAPAARSASGHRRSRTSSLSSANSIASERAKSPTHFVPRGSPPSTAAYLAGVGVTSPSSTTSSPQVPQLPSQPPFPAQPYSTRHAYPTPSAPPSFPSAPPPPPIVPSHPSPPLELTPAVIAKAQKHCRFAISALDYEDAEQARKELRAALALLGER